MSMKSSAKKISLPSLDDIFQTDDSRKESARERVQEIALSELYTFQNHPFKVAEDESMMEMVESIKEYGVLMPGIARSRPQGGYELISGHRRKRASELAQKETMPVIIRELDDNEATIVMVDFNLQREQLLQSEKAWACKMKLDAINHQDSTCGQVANKSKTITKVGQEYSLSKDTVARYLRIGSCPRWLNSSVIMPSQL